MLSDVEYAALESVGKKMSELTSEDLLSMREKGWYEAGTHAQHLEKHELYILYVYRAVKGPGHV